jgi:uncharacterized membrane protein
MPHDPSDALIERVMDLIPWVAAVAVLVAVAVYVVGKIRAESAQKEQTASELLSKCRETHAEGGLSDAEFRTIKTRLATRLEDEIKGNGETG